MTLEPGLAQRLRFLAQVVQKESRHLATTDQRLFSVPFTADRARQLDTDPDLAERVEAFVGRFGRLQDTLGDKLLPALLKAMGEKPGAAIDNLDRAERLGLIQATDDWLTVRQLRNKMVQEYVEDPAQLAEALQTGHEFVATLAAIAQRMIAESQRRTSTPN